METVDETLVRMHQLSSTDASIKALLGLILIVVVAQFVLSVYVQFFRNGREARTRHSDEQYEMLQLVPNSEDGNSDSAL